MIFIFRSRYLCGVALYWLICIIQLAPAQAQNQTQTQIQELTKVEEATTRFTLEDAKRYAIAHNRQVLSLRHAVDAAKAKSGRANVAFYPRLGVAGGVDNEVSAKVNETAPVAYLYASYNIFNGYQDSYQRQIANLEAEKSEIELVQQELLAALEVEKYFHDFLYAKSSINLKEEGIALNGRLAATAARRRSAGLGSEADIMEFELRDAVLKAELVLLGQKLEEARIGLRKTLGEEVGSKIEPVGELQHQHLAGDLMSYLDKLKNSNPILRGSARELAIADFQAQSWRSKWLPKVDLEARAGYLELDAMPEDKSSTVSFLLLAKMDLFSGNEASWERREGAARKLKAEEDLKANLVNMVSDVERYYRRLKAIEKSVDLEEQNELRARSYYDTVLKEYNAGIKNSGDVKVAADMRSEASLRRLRYKYEFLAERIEMEKLLGSSVAVETVEDVIKNHEEKR